MSAPRRACLWVIPAAAMCAYLNVAPNAFVWDSDDLCVDTPHADTLGGALRMFWPTTWEADRPVLRESYRPVALLTFCVERKLWGKGPLGYHLDNAILHALNALAVAWLARRLGLGRRTSLLAGLVFALHPAATEAVAWINNRSVLLATGLTLASLAVALGRGRRHNARAGAAALLMGLAVLSHEGVVLAPLCLAAFAFARPRRPPTSRCWAALLLICAAYLLMRFGLTSVGQPPDARPTQPRPEPRVLSVLRTAQAYSASIVAPIHLCADRAMWPATWRSREGLLALACAAALAVVALVVWRRGREARAALLLTAAFFLPVSNAFFIAGRPLAEQRVYPMLAGVGILAAIAMRRRVALMLLACVVLAASTVSRNSDWANELTLWRSTIRTEPSLARPYLNLGLQRTAQHAPRMALPLFRRSLQLQPAYGLARLMLCQTLQALGRPRQALQVLQIVPQPRWRHEFWTFAGEALWAMGQKDGAIAAFEQGARMQPHAPALTVRLARAYIANAQLPAAESLLAEALRRWPRESAVHAELAALHLARGESKQAAGSAIAALRLDPSSLAGAAALAQALLREKDYPRAATAAKAVLRLDPYRAAMYELLAQAFAAMRQDDTAARYQAWAQRVSAGRRPASHEPRDGAREE